MPPCSIHPPPYTPIHQLKQRVTRGALWEEKRGGCAGGSGVRQGRPNLVTRPKPCSQSLLTRAHPCNHCYPRISSVQPTSGRWKRRRLTECCVSLMYEPALRIDVGEMVNSRFHQTQQESGSLNCEMAFLFYGVVVSGHLGQKAPEWKMCVCVFCLLWECLFSCQWHFKLLNVTFEVNPKTEGLDVLASGVLYHTLWLVLIPLAHWLDSSINWR